jgi:hypothetical protein
MPTPGGDHFYTISLDEANRAVKQYGYTFEGVAGYVVDPKDVNGQPAQVNEFLVPLYRL